MTDFENTVLGDLGFETSNEQQAPAHAYESPLVNPEETTAFDNGVLSNLGFETEQVVPDITSSYEAGGKDDPSIAKQNKDFEQKHGMSLSDMTQIDPARAEVCKILNTTPEDFSKTYPRLANAYSNPYILSMAKEDTQSLMRIENGLKLLENQRNVANQVLGDQAENIDEEGATSGWESGDVRDQGPNVISATVQQGASQLFGGLFKTAISAVEAAGGNPDTLKVFDKSLNQIKQGIDSWGDDFTTMNKEWNWLQKNLAGGASSGVMMSLTYGAGFMLAAGLMASGIGTPAAMALMGKLSLGLMAMSAYGQAYDEGRKKGLSVGEAAGHGAWQGGWEYITEKMNIKAVKDLYFANKPMLRDIANFMKKEVGTEELNSFMQGIEEAFVMPDQTVGEFLKPANLLNMVAETAIQTVVGAGVQTGTARGLHSLVTSDTMQLGGAVIELAKTQENVNLLRSMADYAQNSALAQRAPEQLAKVVAEVTKNDTPWAYISNEALTPAIRDRIRAVAPDLDEAITKAVTLQEDLAMPIEAFAQIINDESVVETLNDHVKFDQNGITVSEAKQNLAVIAEQSKAEVARLIEEQKKAADGTSETQQIIDDLTPILRDTGTIIGQTAKDQAVLWGKFFTRLSGQFQKAGKTVTPMELYKKYRSKIVGPDTEMVRMDTFNRMSKASRGLASLLSEFDKKVTEKGSKWGQVQWLKERVTEAVKTLPEGNEMRTQLENIKSRNSNEYRNKVEAILKSAQHDIDVYKNSISDGLNQVISTAIPSAKFVNNGSANDSRYFHQFASVESFENDPVSFLVALRSLRSISGLDFGRSLPTEKYLKELVKELKKVRTKNTRLHNRIEKDSKNFEAKGKGTAKEYLESHKERVDEVEASDKALYKTQRSFDNAFNTMKSASEEIVSRMQRNLEFLFDQIPENIRDRTKLWYVGANKTAQAWAKRYGLRLRQTAAVIAVLSPKNNWFNNMTQAERILDIFFDSKDFKPDDEMKEFAAKLCAAKPKKAKKDATEEEKKEAEESLGDSARLDDVQNKSLAEIIKGGDLRTAAIWIRAYDETHNDSRVYVQTPEGGRGGYYTGKKGKNLKVVWASYRPVMNALSVILDGSVDNIDNSVGVGFKVRDFYNNIFDPYEDRAATIDTHAVGANTLNVMSQNDDAVKINFGSKAKSGSTGQKGTYAFHFEALRRAAISRGFSPREMQSITWEAIRALFRDDQKKSLRPDVAEVWKKVESGEITEDEARKQIVDVAGGFDRMAWEETPYNDIPLSTYERPEGIDQRLENTVVQPNPEMTISLEVAPNENPDIDEESPLSDAEKQRSKDVIEKWHSLTPSQQRRINDSICPVAMESIAELLGVRISTPKAQLGGWLGDVNSSSVYEFEKPEDALRVGLLTSYVLDKQGAYVTSGEYADGLNEESCLRIDVSQMDEASITDLYQGTIDKIVDNDGNRIILGMSSRDGILYANFRKDAEKTVIEQLESKNLNQEWFVDTAYAGAVCNHTFRIVENNDGKRSVEDAADFKRRRDQALRTLGNDPEFWKKAEDLRSEIRDRFDSEVQGAIAEAEVQKAVDSPTDSFAQRVSNILPQAVRDAMRQIAYNGSPFRFDRFSLDHIGSGEGAQAHGWGLYFTMTKGIAESYRSRLSRFKVDEYSLTISGKPIDEFREELDRKAARASREEATLIYDKLNILDEYQLRGIDGVETAHLSYGKEFSTDAAYEWFEKEVKPNLNETGRVYVVEIPESEMMIKERTPFKEQPEYVQKKMKELLRSDEVKRLMADQVIEAARLLDGAGTGIAPNHEYANFRKVYSILKTAKDKDRLLNIDEIESLKRIKEELKGTYSDVNTFLRFLLASYRKNGISPSMFPDHVNDPRRMSFFITNNERDASLLLNKFGIPGITYNGQEDGPCAVVWDEESIKIVDFFEKNPEKLMEAKGEANVGAERGDIAGWWSKKENTLGLTKHTNITTFAHESGHMFLNIYFEIARDADSPQSIKRDVATLLDWFGLKDLQQYFDLEAKGPDFVREYHEKFARGFEAYLREGKAPSKGLEDIFYKFKRWITDWYKDKTDKETIDNAQSDLTADVRAVMARMLASEEEIDMENKIRSFANLWQDRKNFPGNDEQYLDYIKLVKDSDLEARAMLTAAYMEELEFMTERKTVIMAELANQYNEEYNDAYEDAKERLLSNPLYKALERITKDEEAVSLKIATSEVSTLPDNTVARLNALGVLSEDGMPLEAVSKQLGFEDSVEFINGMSKLQPLEQKAREMAEAQMTVDNEDIMTREGRDAVATAAVMNELAMKRAEKEYAIVKATKKTPELVSAATLDAEEAFGSMRLGSVKIGHYKQKANKASQNAVAAAAKGDTQAAADAKKAEVFSMAKAKKAADIINRKEKLVKLALRMKRKAKKLAQRRQLDSQFIDQVLSLMSHYTTRRNGKTVILGIENPSRRSFAEFKKAWTEKGVPLDAIDDTLFSGIKDIDDMTVDQFDTLADAVSILVTQGRRVSQISKENYKVNLQNIADACALEIESSNKEIPFKVSRTDSRIQKIKGYFLSHRKLSSMIYELGGFKYGTMADVILTRLNDAASREATMTTDFGKKYWDLVKGLNNLNEKAVVKGIHTPNGAIVSEMMTKRDRLSIALNAGNVDNKQRLEADGFDQLTIYNVFSTLTDDEIQFVQNAWDLIDQFWKPLADLELRTNGLEPKKVLPVPITVMSKNQNKIELKGGYYPIKYDTSKNTQAAENELKDYADSLFRGAVTSSATKQGHAKRREEKTDMHLLLDPNVIGIHAQQVIHDLCFREALQDINKLFRNDTFKNAVVSRKGADWYSEMTDSLNSIAINGSTAERMNKEANSAFGYLRGTLSASVMGLSATTALLQPLGLLQSAARLGPKAILSGIVHSLENNKNNSCYDKSEMMRNRRLTMNTEIREVGRSMSRIGNPKLGKAWQDFNKVLFAPMMAMQQIVDVPTWYGAYDLARSEGKTEKEAIAFADQSVIDTQGSGDIKDTSKIHRNNPIWMMFYSYFSATYQLIVESGKKNASKGALGATLFARDVVMLLAIPNIVTALFFGYLRGTEPPEDEGEWLMFALREFGGAVLNMFFLVRELNPVIEAAFQMGGGNAPSYNGPAVMRIVPDLTRLTQAMLGDKDAFDKTMAVMPFIGDITGLPTVQLQRSLKGAKAYIDGETDMPTAVLFGKPTKEF